MINNVELYNRLSALVRTIKARVEFYNDSTLLSHYAERDDLISITIERVGDETKFFGYGICQKVNIKLIDKAREKDISTANTVKVYFDDLCVSPLFKVSRVNRDENTNALSITAYDYIYNASNIRTQDIPISSYTIAEFANSCSSLLGLNGVSILGVNDGSFDTNYEAGANIDGTETIREVLDDVAEATQTIYYVDAANTLIFKRLDVDGEAAFVIDKSKYITLENSDSRRLGTVCHATELGDNVSASIAQSGTTQYVRDNPFWDLREDIDELVNKALDAVGGLTINQFNCQWRGNYLVEIGDKLGLITKDDDTLFSYLLNDTITYDGSYSQKTQWRYSNSDTETESNPTSLGDVLKQTYARVDKANKQVELVVSDVESNSQKITSIQMDTESINATVKQVEENTNNAIDGVNEDIATLTKQVNSKVSAEQLTIEIQTQLSNGVNSITTNTGYTFNDEGLTVSKDGSEMTTTVSEDGMIVYKNGSAVLTANNVGVEAVNLHAKTYLIIGTNSRFEDYNNGARTGCFWIGG